MSSLGVPGVPLRLLVLLWIMFQSSTFAFLVEPQAAQRLQNQQRGLPQRVVLPSKSSTSRLFLEVSITTPSSDEAANMGIREWPQQLKKGAWAESVPEGNTVVRYVLDGTGSVKVSSDDGVDGDQQKVGPGTLVEVTGAASLEWNTDEEMIILTPGFEEGTTLIAVALGAIVIFGALLAGVGS